MSLVRKALGAAVVILMLIPSWAFAVTPTPIKVTRNFEYGGSGNADFFAWTFQSRRHPNTSRIKVDPTTAPVFTANNRGRWIAGTMGQTGSLLPYTRLTGRRNNNLSSDIHLYDMAVPAKVADPPHVNTGKFEYFPALDGNQLTFVRDSGSTSTLWLVTDISTGAKIEVATIDRTKAFFANAPNLIDHWVTYALCKRSGCEAYRYDTDLDSRVKVPNPLDKLYFAPSADLAGNVYVERSSPGCGRQARLVKWTPGSDPSVFYSFDPGIDMIGTSVFDDGVGNVTLYSDFFDCADGDLDIWSFLNP
jgi:hypothetical protein